MLLVEMWNSKKALSRVAGHPAAEVRVIPAPTQEKEEDLTNLISKHIKKQNADLSFKRLQRATAVANFVSWWKCHHFSKVQSTSDKVWVKNKTLILKTKSEN